jgi:hypothetical protein
MHRPASQTSGSMSAVARGPWKRLAPWVVALGVTGVPTRVFAQSSADKAAAEALFDEGKRLMAEKQFAQACPKLADSQRLDPGVGTLLNLALCYKSNGQTASAWSTYREAAAQARASGQADREQLARNEATALERSLSRLTIEVSPELAATPGLEIKRDGASVPQGLWGVAAPVDPGARVLEATAPGKQPLRMTVNVAGAGASARAVVPPLENAAAGAPSPVTTPTAPAPVAPAPPPPPAPTPAPEASSGSGQRIAGYAVAGVGVVGLAVGSVFGAMTMSTNEDALDLCKDSDDPCTSDDVRRHRRLVDDAKSSRIISYIGFGAGGAALLGGVVLILTAPKGATSSSPTGLRLAPHVGKGELGFGMEGTW